MPENRPPEVITEEKESRTPELIVGQDAEPVLSTLGPGIANQHSYNHSSPAGHGSPVGHGSPDLPKYSPSLQKSDKKAKKKPLSKWRMFLFGIIVACSLATQFIILGYMNPHRVQMPIIANCNTLALGAAAKVQHPVEVAVEPSVTINKLTKKEICDIRSSFAQKHPEFFNGAYVPSTLVYGLIVDGLPWGGEKGFYAWEIEKDLQAGRALHGTSIANPFLLIFPDWLHPLHWNHDLSPADLDNFSFLPLPKTFTWDAKHSRMEATIDKTGWKRQFLEKNHWRADTNVDGLDRVSINDSNAGDMGYNFKRILIKDERGETHDVTPKVLTGNRLAQFLHKGNYLGNCWNNLGRLNGPPLNEVDMKVGTDIIEELWRQEPKPDTPPDLTAVLHIK